MLWVVVAAQEMCGVQAVRFGVVWEQLECALPNVCLDQQGARNDNQRQDFDRQRNVDVTSQKNYYGYMVSSVIIRLECKDQLMVRF